MLSEVLILSATATVSASVVPLLWWLRMFSILRMVILLFVADIAMTVEAALYSDLLLIALLHVFTIPCFFALIYFDLVKEHRTYASCFICGKKITEEDEITTLQRNTGSEPRSLQVHKSCVRLEGKERKTLSEKLFKKGIPE
jgi:hypothetical protein